MHACYRQEGDPLHVVNQSSKMIIFACNNYAVKYVTRKSNNKKLIIIEMKVMCVLCTIIII